LADLIFKITLSYLLGSLLGSLVIGKLKGVDIRQQGSGNAGGTNALRTQGWQFAAGVMLIDIGKGWLAAALIPSWTLAGFPASVAMIWTQIACAIAVVVGHVYPLWFGFRGGKGAATLVGVVAGLVPAALPYVLGSWLLVLMLTGFVGLSTMLATAGFNVWVWLAGPVDNQPLRVFGVLMMVFVVFTHRSNIQRMRSGTENRARKLWLFKPRA
jgi:acyl phosphate:glycerol-3-phosphate acyltransferase